MIASSLCHSNIVPLVGFCIESGGGFVLGVQICIWWKLRNAICTEVKGSSGPFLVCGDTRLHLELHKQLHICIMELRDVLFIEICKPSNILLFFQESHRSCRGFRFSYLDFCTFQSLSSVKLSKGDIWPLIKPRAFALETRLNLYCSGEGKGAIEGVG
ncbi:hypothetical protein NC653_038798 [Populus alba x Populus x berolinensis]|uniref:Uncharacterized protein n=1 Tax=Populus alba x Populus x berolinensis TaxID=444605 RepID=A0AAD6LHL6_9ROSI|nr:hypothetical protein NC653_038798 [Populus alba x Populus x berolinensis]